MRLSLIPLRSLRMNGNNVGIWVEVFIKMLWPHPPVLCFTKIVNRISSSTCNVKLNVGFTNFVRVIHIDEKFEPKLGHFSLKFHRICLSASFIL